MGAYNVLQQLVTISGDSATDGGIFIQPQEEWLNVIDWADAILVMTVRNVSATGSDTVDLVVGTTSELGNSDLLASGGAASDLWTEADIGVQSYRSTSYLDYNNATPMERFLFWKVKVNGTSGSWKLTFKLTGTFKRRA